MSKLCLFFATFSQTVLLLAGELWEEDVSTAMKIGISTTGYKSVDLRCDANHFSVNVTLENDFEGVVYTRGSFETKESSCFKRHNQNTLRDDNMIMISLRIPFHRCRTVMDVGESCFTNTLIVQHDPDLIMPGDAAFSLKCAFVPEYKENGDVNAELPFKSKIILVDADPSDKSSEESQDYSVSSKSEKISFVPLNSKKAKDEL